ncbi:MAG: PAS domain-containing protein [Clostridia bacterium]|nr:PAS domain-containing protein [Clostridia bacterium]
MTRRIFRSVVISALLAATLAAALIVLSLFGIYEGDMTGELRSEADSLRYALSRAVDEQAYFDGFSSRNRVTLIAGDGTVLYDSSTDAAALDNHALRPEVQNALENGWGEAERYSDTLAESTYYYALRTDDGNILRVASVRSSALGVLLSVLPSLSVIIAVVVLFSLVIARIEAQRIVAPLNALDLRAPLENKIYDELTPLLTRMDRHMRARDEARRNLSTIVDNMREGMVLLDYQGIILAMNSSAEIVLGVSDGDNIGKDMLSACHTPGVGDAVYTALTGRYTSLPMEWNGRHYQLLANPVLARGRTEGAVLLVLDVTEHYAAEQSRREFTANVSHELKTPLTSISGYAEIIRDGVARPEDIPGFAGRIHSEAARLLNLINDILALSRLDERRGIGESENMSLLAAAQEAAAGLEVIAREKGVELHVTGDSGPVRAYRVLLGEMLYNLIDNAVKYTPAGGRVDVQVKGTRCMVRDTGIGIPAEHQGRIFERFYRVDKSHSRATGGTGLGLSIVKHGAEIHGAEIRLDSREGRGTCITLEFPPLA